MISFRNIVTLGSDEVMLLRSPGYPQRYGFATWICVYGKPLGAVGIVRLLEVLQYKFARFLVGVHVVRMSKLHMVLHRLCIVRTCMGGVAKFRTGHLI